MFTVSSYSMNRTETAKFLMNNSVFPLLMKIIRSPLVHLMTSVIIPLQIAISIGGVLLFSANSEMLRDFFSFFKVVLWQGYLSRGFNLNRVAPRSENQFEIFSKACRFPKRGRKLRRCSTGRIWKAFQFDDKSNYGIFLFESFHCNYHGSKDCCN